MEYLRRTQAMALSKNFKIIGFGTGIIGHKTAKYLNGVISYFVDNKAVKWGNDWEGKVALVSPDELRKEKSQSIVLICSEQHEQIAEQVRSIRPDLTIMLSPLLEDYEVFSTLKKCSRNIIVSAYGADGGIYFVDGQAATFNCLEKGTFRGLTLAGEKLFVATEQGLCEIRSINPFILEHCNIKSQLHQAHGLAYWEKERTLIIAEATNDCLSFFNIDTFEKTYELPISEKSGMSGHQHFLEQDHHHINDIYVHEDSVFISMISRSGWWQKGVFDGCILETNLRRKGNFNVVVDQLLFPHSIKIINNKLYILEAVRGNIRIGADRILIHLPGFLRGLAAGSKGVIYVGQSRPRRLRETYDQYNNISMDSGIYVVSTEEKIFRFIHLPEMCDVYSIMDLEQTDLQFFK